MKIIKGDEVIVTKGKDKGKKGRVMRVYPKENMLLIEKINYRTVFLRKSQDNPKGGITKVEGKLSVSNVKLVCPRSGKPTRVGYSVLADGSKHRLAKKSGEVL
ncbi:MAG TPA: 50S ribosomal protein L24 [Candidatus Omnitrophota bacterium]|jgi:large subunit ribosomal protein L24|nr:MAG: 50S ribosomal protein L24 [Candidatus Omnitrophica bacterium ADurb.Bin314]HOE68258.1 50S ribosomal protein L24 [Candidatus Omnitrophota bacterium]HQB93808.1 50S ribosomal protein L24 [Candidatus Omnitrophota bacterium]